MTDKIGNKPEQLEKIDLTEVRKALQVYMDAVDICIEGDEFDDWEYEIYEKVLEAFYGKTIWIWINDKII